MLVSCEIQQMQTRQVLLRGAPVVQFFTCRWSHIEVTTSNYSTYYSFITLRALRSERL